MAKPAKKAKPVDLSEYAEEAVPFDTVMRQILRAPPAPRTAPAPKPAKKAQKRK
ncbi:MAG: hypothetical protein Q8L95_02580 [Burkholderiales bacterium]|nr:hypothetical protein [Burkholderiales bacterium]